MGGGLLGRSGVEGAGVKAGRWEQGRGMDNAVMECFSSSMKGGRKAPHPLHKQELVPTPEHGTPLDRPGQGVGKHLVRTLRQQHARSLWWAGWTGWAEWAGRLRCSPAHAAPC